MRCGNCGCGKFVYSTQGDRYGNHHGAVCASCHKPLTLMDTPYYAAAGGPVYRRRDGTLVRGTQEQVDFALKRVSSQADR